MAVARTKKNASAERNLWKELLHNSQVEQAKAAIFRRAASAEERRKILAELDKGCRQSKAKGVRTAQREEIRELLKLTRRIDRRLITMMGNGRNKS